jgi:hypothetical protein
MSDVEKKKISQLPSGTLTQTSYFESAIPSGNDYVSNKVTPADIGNIVATAVNYSGLTTTSKTLEGSINEVSTAANTANSRIDALPSPMVFKGTLGTGGTIETLPAASTSNEGFTYKVITDGTYASIAAKAGDTFVSNGTAWVLIPSGDEPTDLVISDTLTAGSTSITFQNAAITTSSLVDVYAEAWWVDLVQSTGSVVITFPAQTTDMTVKICVH